MKRFAAEKQARQSSATDPLQHRLAVRVSVCVCEREGEGERVSQDKSEMYTKREGEKRDEWFGGGSGQNLPKDFVMSYTLSLT